MISHAAHCSVSHQRQFLAKCNLVLDAAPYQNSSATGAFSYPAKLCVCRCFASCIIPDTAWFRARFMTILRAQNLNSMPALHSAIHHPNISKTAPAAEFFRVAHIIRPRKANPVKTLAVDIDGTITENGGGRIHLGALWALRCLSNMGHNVIFVSGRSSVEGYLLSVFGGTTKTAIGENGGCITHGPRNHVLLGDMKSCRNAYDILRTEIENVAEKPVFPRMTEIVLQRTFDLNAAKDLISDKNLDVVLSDSRYAFHINSHNVNKGTGMEHLMRMRSISKDDVIAIGDSETDMPLFGIAGTSIALGNASSKVRECADIATRRKAGDGVLEALSTMFPDMGAEHELQGAS